MKNRASLLFFFLFASHLLRGTDCMAAEKPWEKIETRDDITLYERWFKGENNVDVKERKGEMVVRASMSQVLETLCNPAQMPLWMENVQESYFIRRLSDQEWYSYTRFSLPWPLQNRDLICYSRLNRPNSRTATIDMSSREWTIPPKQDVKRLTHYKAIWKIADIGNGTLCISFAAQTSKPPEFPRFLQEPLVRGAFLRSLVKLKLILDGKKS